MSKANEQKVVDLLATKKEGLRAGEIASALGFGNNYCSTLITRLLHKHQIEKSGARMHYIYHLPKPKKMGPRSVFELADF